MTLEAPDHVEREQVVDGSAPQVTEEIVDVDVPVRIPERVVDGFKVVPQQWVSERIVE